MTRAREAARLIGNNTFRLDSNNAVGFNSTTPDAMFDINHGLTVAGVSTFSGNVTMSGDLTVQGTTTTLDTTLQEVDLINVQANSSTPAIGVTQSGSGAIFAGYDGASEVFTVTDSGSVGVGENSPMSLLHIKSGDSGASSVESGSFLTVESNGTSAIQMLSGTSSNNYIYFGDSGDTNTGSIQYSHGANALIFRANGGSERLRITSGGNVSIQNDSGKFTVGAGDDLQMYHDGTHSRIVDNRDSGTLRLQADGFKVIDKDAGETMISAVVDGAVELYYDNSKKFETTSGGVEVTGSVTATSFSGNGANLTGLPAGFTELDAALFN